MIGQTTRPLLKRKGSKLLRKPMQTRYLFDVLDSHGLSAYCPLENNFH